MDFTLGRIKKTLKELDNNVYSKNVCIQKIMMKEGFFSNIDEVDQSSESWRNFKCGEFWGGIDKDAWLRFDINIPEEFEGKTTALYLSTGIDDFEKEETTINPQMLLYLNREIIQGLDINHREVILSENSQEKEKYQVDIKINSGMYDRKFLLEVKLVIIDKDTRKLYYNIKVPYDVARNLQDGDYTKLKILEILNETINHIDFRSPHSDLYYKSIKKANKYINEEFYKKMCGTSSITASIIGHTHIDIAWLWTVAQTREKVARSFSTVLNLMKQYPEYKFMSSMPQLYKFLKEDYPMLYEEVKKKIKEKRWEADGAMWVEPDCNLTSGESLVRQILYGTRFFREEFGIECNVLWLPDDFGYNAALPQIMKKSGIKYFMSCKMGWNDTNRMPFDTFMWRGLDGSEILTHFITTTYPRASVTSYATDYNGQLFPETVMGAWNKYRHKTLNDDILISFGYGDGGGGPTEEMLENHRRMSKGIPGCPKTEVCTVNQYFEKLEKKIGASKDIPKWNGEIYFEYHRGTYTSIAREKKANRKCEIALSNAEKLNTIDMTINNNKYKQKELDKSWETLLKNQFHDILPGSCIKEVYEVTKKEHELIEKSMNEIIKNSLDNICNKINLRHDSIVLFNTLSFNRNDVVEVDIPKDYDKISIVDGNNKQVQSQIIGDKENKGVVFYAQNIPSNGYSVYTISHEEDSIDKYFDDNNDEFKISKDRMCNKFFDIKLDEKGSFTSIYDNMNNREILKKCQRGNRLLAYEDKPMAYENWNISNYYKEKVWEIDEITRAQVVEDGPVRKILEIEKCFLTSKIVQKIIIYKDINRIDFHTYIDWKETDILLKANFPIDVNTRKAVFDIQFGNVERSTHNNTSWDQAQYEVSAHKWVDLSEEGYGVSLLNDCKYGYDVKDENLNITLLKCGTYPNPDADKEEHRFVYSLFPHSGNWKEANTNAMALCLNVPVISKYEKAHDGILPDNFSFINIDCNNVCIDTIKKSEDGSDIIVRMYEFFNKRTIVNCDTFFDLSSVLECDLMENDIENIDHGKKHFSFEIKPYEIKTFRLQIDIESSK